MITIQTAIRNFNETHPGRTINLAVDYDTTWYILAAPKNGDISVSDISHFAVNKRTGEIRAYYPSADLDKFTEAVEKRTIKLN